ncbi:MAG: hypothetical protein AAFP04_03760 [Myxococcota bacterium]
MYRTDLVDPTRLKEFVRTVTDPNPANHDRVRIEEALIRGGEVGLNEIKAYMEVFAKGHSTRVLNQDEYRAVSSWLINLVNSRMIPERKVELFFKRPDMLRG